MRRKIIVSVVLVATILGAGASIGHFLIQSKAPAESRPPQRRPLLVKTTRLVPRTVVEPIVGYGTARADLHARLSAQVAGEIVELPDGVKPGGAVRKGDLLLRIDDADYRQTLERAQGQLAEATSQRGELDLREANLERLLTTARRQLESAEWESQKVEKLFLEGDAPEREQQQARYAAETARLALQRLENEKTLLPSQRTQVEARCRTYRAQVASSQLDVDRCRMTAPFDGLIEAVRVELGEQVGVGAGFGVGTTLISLLDPRLIEVVIELPVSIHPSLRVGADCTLSTDTGGGRSWKGQVVRISPAADETSRTVEVYVEVDNDRQTDPLLPGVFVRAVIDGPTFSDVLIIPRSAIRKNHVFVLRDDRAFPRRVEVRRRLIDQSVITGLSSGDVVITSNLDVLHEGTAVRREEALLETADHKPPTDPSSLATGTP